MNKVSYEFLRINNNKLRLNGFYSAIRDQLSKVNACLVLWPLKRQSSLLVRFLFKKIQNCLLYKLKRRETNKELHLEQTLNPKPTLEIKGKSKIFGN